MKDDCEKRIAGSPVSEGLACGSLFVLREPSNEGIPEFVINHHEAEAEILRFRNAVKHSQTDLEDLSQVLQSQGNEEAALVIDAHIQMLQDPMITQAVEGGIRNTRKNVESVFRNVIKDIENQLNLSDDVFFQERSVDITDVSYRVMGYLRQNNFLKCDNIPPNSIVVVKQLIPSHVAAFESGKVIGIISELGGGSCHAALIARSKGIPYVTRVDIEKLLEQAEGKEVVIDGTKGEIIVAPLTSTKAQLKLNPLNALKNKKVVDFDKRENELTTKDGLTVRLFANVSESEEAAQLQSMCLNGVGLFRSEYIFLQNKNLLLFEDGQFAIYKELIQKAKGLPVVIRLLDVGGDKDPAYFLHDKERFGAHILERGIRFLLKNRDVFLTQIKALLRAAMYGDLRILIPFVSDIQEIRDTKELIKEASLTLKKEGKLFKKKISLGSMIELPAAVMICDMLARECSFLSLGTNDLYQFATGVDRSEVGAISGVFPFPPSLVRMIQRVSSICRENKIDLCICGEMASNPFFMPLLLGLGIKDISCALRFAPRVIEAIKTLNYKEAVSLVNSVIKKQTASEINKLLEKFVRSQTALETSHSY